jgi:uncharacterized repeat protein (TIGR01451 family)
MLRTIRLLVPILVMSHSLYAQSTTDIFADKHFCAPTASNSVCLNAPSGLTVPAGQPVSMIISVSVMANQALAANVVITDVLPAGLTFRSNSAVPSGGTCTTPAVGSGGTIQCSYGTLASPVSPSCGCFAKGVFQRVELDVAPTVAAGTIISNTETATTTTPEVTTANNTSTAALNVVAPVPTLTEWALIALAGVLTLFAVARLK